MWMVYYVIVDTTRNHVLLLISRSYTNIKLEDVLSLTGLSGPDLLQGCHSGVLISYILVVHCIVGRSCYPLM